MDDLDNIPEFSFDSKAVPCIAIAEMLAEVTLKQHPDFSQFGFVPDEKQRWELLVVNMFGVQRAVMSVLKDKPELVQKLLDYYHLFIRDACCQTEDHQIAFDENLPLRYEEYWEAIRRRRSSPFSLAVQISRNLEILDLAVAHAVSEILSRKTVAITKLLRKLTDKFTLIP